MALISPWLINVSNAQQLTDITYGKGVNLIAADSSFSMKFNYRMQNLLIAEMPSDYTGIEDVSANWLVRRSRLKFSGFAYTPRLKYKIELGLSNRDHGGESPETGNTSNLILDAFFKWKTCLFHQKSQNRVFAQVFDANVKKS